MARTIKIKGTVTFQVEVDAEPTCGMNKNNRRNLYAFSNEVLHNTPLHKMKVKELVSTDVWSMEEILNGTKES